MYKKLFPVIVIGLLMFLVPLSAQSEGIPLQKDVFLGSPILAPEDLPGEITFTLYDSKTGIESLGSQSFVRGQYTVEFEFSKSDGISSGNIARINANFTNTLNLKDAEGNVLRPKEIWAALEVAGAEVGERSKVSDDTLVQLLLASDASIATYLTLAYEGDDNPITTIYKSLPISSVAGDNATSLSDYFSVIAAGGQVIASADARENAYWTLGASSSAYYNSGNVGIGTSSPSAKLDVDRGNIELTPGQGLVSTSSSTAYLFRYGLDYFTLYTVPGDGSGGFKIFDRFRSTDMAVFKEGGFVGIGTTNPEYMLTVNGSIGCKELTVSSDLTRWADFVFQESYRLLPLEEVETFIGENKHLPGIPSEVEVKKMGINLGEISSKLLQKIEELTLYMIELKKENEALKSQMGRIEGQLLDSK